MFYVLAALDGEPTCIHSSLTKSNADRYAGQAAEAGQSQVSVVEAADETTALGFYGAIVMSHPPRQRD
jgi:hypothetical protein